MYTPAHFAANDPSSLHELVRQYPLGMLVTQCNGMLDANHIPFELLVADDGSVRLLAHVARANPVWQQLCDGDGVLVVFRAEDGYISPNWYPSKHEGHRQVPTWNYRVVHAHGKITVHDDAKFLRGVVGRLTRTHEARTQAQSPRTHAPWKMSDAAPGYLEQMLDAIIGLEIQVTRWEGKFKLGQNRSTDDLQGAIQGAADAGNGMLAGQMKSNAPTSQ